MGDVLEEDVKKVQELAEAYNATIDAAFETKDAIKELIYSKLDINAQKITVELEFKTNLTELTTSYNEFLNEIEAGFNKINYATISARTREDLGAIQDSIDAYRESYRDLISTDIITPKEIELLNTAFANGNITEAEMNKTIGNRITLADKEN
jgi:hypothetical protein